jgi:ribulose-phosphate 3-epimerase
MSIIVPAFLVQSEQEFIEKLKLVEQDCSLIQVDVLDGSLFPNISWFDPIAIGHLSTTVEMELHLMVENPIPIIEAWQKHVPTFKRAIVSAEMHRPDGSVTTYVKDMLHLNVGIAINPETPLKEIEEVLHEIDQLTVMGVHPGKSGQPFEGEYILDKIQQAKHHRPELIVEMDGGVTEDLIPKLIEVGVDRIVCGSLIFKNEHPTKELQRLNQLVQKSV